MSGPVTDSHRPVRIAGNVLVALGILHTLATLGGAGEIFLAAVQAGWWRTADVSIGADAMQVAVFWSLQFGAMLGLMGWVLRRVSVGAHPLSRAWSVVFGLVCLAGALAVPPGGFWFGALLGGWLAGRGNGT